MCHMPCDLPLSLVSYPFLELPHGDGGWELFACVRADMKRLNLIACFATFEPKPPTMADISKLITTNLGTRPIGREPRNF